MNDALEHKRIDVMQFAFGKLPQVDCPLTHRFTPGLYSREIFMPAGTLVVSRKHKTRHQYVVLSGEVMVFIPGVGVQTLREGHVGITEAGTRRALFIVRDCRWVTFHPTEETDMDRLQEQLTETPDVSYVEDDDESKAMISQLQEARKSLEEAQ